MIYQTSGLNITSPAILMENRLSAEPGGVVSASGGAAFAPNVLSPTTWDSWTGNINGWVAVAFAAAFAIDSFGLAGHNLGSIGATLRFGYKASPGAAWTLMPEIRPVDNSPILLLSPAIAGSEFRVHVVASGGAVPIIGSFWAGRRMVLPSSVAPDYVRAPDAVTVEGEAAVSRGGHYLGATFRRRAGQLSPQFNPIARGWADLNLPAFRQHYDARRAFFFASSPGIYPDDLAYGWRGERASELRPVLSAGGAYVRVSMELDFHAA